MRLNGSITKARKALRELGADDEVELIDADKEKEAHADLEVKSADAGSVHSDRDSGSGFLFGFSRGFVTKGAAAPSAKAPDAKAGGPEDAAQATPQSDAAPEPSGEGPEEAPGAQDVAQTPPAATALPLVTLGTPPLMPAEPPLKDGSSKMSIFGFLVGKGTDASVPSSPAKTSGPSDAAMQPRVPSNSMLPELPELPEPLSEALREPMSPVPSPSLPTARPTLDLPPLGPTGGEKASRGLFGIKKAFRRGADAGEPPAPAGGEQAPVATSPAATSPEVPGALPELEVDLASGPGAEAAATAAMSSPRPTAACDAAGTPATPGAVPAAAATPGMGEPDPAGPRHPSPASVSKGVRSSLLGIARGFAGGAGRTTPAAPSPVPNDGLPQSDREEEAGNNLSSGRNSGPPSEAGDDRGASALQKRAEAAEKQLAAMHSQQERWQAQHAELEQELRSRLALLEGRGDNQGGQTPPPPPAAPSAVSGDAGGVQASGPQSTSTPQVIARFFGRSAASSAPAAADQTPSPDPSRCGLTERPSIQAFQSCGSMGSMILETPEPEYASEAIIYVSIILHTIPYHTILYHTSPRRSARPSSPSRRRCCPRPRRPWRWRTVL